MWRNHFIWSSRGATGVKTNVTQCKGSVLPPKDSGKEKGFTGSYAVNPLKTRCRRQDLNMHGIAPASPSSQCVCHLVISGSHCKHVEFSLKTQGISEFTSLYICIALGWHRQCFPQIFPKGRCCQSRLWELGSTRLCARRSIRRMALA